MILSQRCDKYRAIVLGIEFHLFQFVQNFPVSCITKFNQVSQSSYNTQVKTNPMQIIYIKSLFQESHVL